MTGPFRRFVILAGMRTGSNYLERLLGQFDALACHGELFNPAFIGKKDRTEHLGLTLSDREADPMRLIEAVEAEAPDRIHGFRLFGDHDTRVLDAVLEDKATAKILLRREAIHSYVSLVIARATDQWMLGNVARRRQASARFDAEDFRRFRTERDAFEATVLSRLKASGQAPYVIDFTDLKSPDVINGLAQFIGTDQRCAEFDQPIKRQNPEPLAEKVENFAEMRRFLADDIQLDEEVPAPASRGPSVPAMITAVAHPVLFAPIPGNPTGRITDWLATHGGHESEHNRSGLHAWLDAHPRHFALTIVDHPLSRAWRTFVTRIVSTGGGNYPKVRRRLANHHGVDLPEDPARWPAEDRHRSFEAFLQFLKSNIAGQTGIRIDPEWAPQDDLVSGFAGAIHLGTIIRAGEPPPVSAVLDAMTPLPTQLDTPAGLREIYSSRLENLARAAYPHDYRKFGFSDWSGSL